MTKITQYNDFACLAACLESLLKDNQKPFDHQQFVQANLDIFHGGQRIEGACDSKDFPEVAKRIGLKFDRIPNWAGATFSPPKETIIFAAHWKGDHSHKHAVRFFEQRSGQLRVMNPLIGDYDDLDQSWIIGVYKFSVV
jgi:hypothetical protein